VTATAFTAGHFSAVNAAKLCGIIGTMKWDLGVLSGRILRNPLGGSGV
jgi:hypothetical protein